MTSATWLNLAPVYAPLLAIVTPLAGAALTALVPNGRASWFVASLAALVTAWVAAMLPGRLTAEDGATVLTSFGLHADAGFVIAPLIAAAGALAILAAGAGRDYAPRAAPLAYALMLVMIAGWIGALMAATWVGVVIAAEAAWLAAIGVVALTAERDRAALNGALRMLVVGGVGAALMLLGAGLIDRGAGSMRIVALAEGQVDAPNLVATGIGLVLAGLAAKAGAAPLHFWLGAAFGRTAGSAALALGAIGAAGALGVMLRVAGYGLSAPQLGAGIAAALVTLGAISVGIGSIQGVGARNLRRMAAYASVAQVGCVLLSAALGSPAGYAAALVQLFALAAAAVALFAGFAAIGGNGTLSTLDGLGRRAPLASAALTAGALSLIGAPLTVGYLGRWRMIEAGVNAGWWWAALAVIVASLAAVFYGGRIIERLYFRKSSAPFQGGGEAWRFMLAPALIASILAIAIGLQPSWLIRITDAAGALMAGHAL